MARDKGRDKLQRERPAKWAGNHEKRRVYVYAEGKVTEKEYIDLIHADGIPKKPDQKVDIHFMNAMAVGDDRKPLTMVKQAVKVLRDVERQAERNGLDEDDWRWPHVWVLFDRDRHEDITEAFKMAKKAGVRIAYSHPCFELWRLLHYKNYTSTFGGVCDSANDKLREQPGFAQTYGKNVKKVSVPESKHVHPGQITGKVQGRSRYANAKRFAQTMSERHDGVNQNDWDPYTDMWRFVEEGLLLSGY
ncbi:RloB family protein [Streptomyces lydicus]|uniref:RloB family protein n=1 Tax=Streptomyces lydicus TaxID=47763 RepID=UPI0036CE9282